MSDLATFDQEHPQERLTRKQRAERLTSGPRGADLLTDAERSLLATLRVQHFDVQNGWLVIRGGSLYRHPRKVVKGSRSWAFSLDR